MPRRSVRPAPIRTLALATRDSDWPGLFRRDAVDALPRTNHDLEPFFG